MGVVAIRLSDEEETKIRKEALAEGVSISAFCRGKILSSSPASTTADCDVLDQKICELGDYSYSYFLQLQADLFKTRQILRQFIQYVSKGSSQKSDEIFEVAQEYTEEYIAQQKQGKILSDLVLFDDRVGGR